MSGILQKYKTSIADLSLILMTLIWGSTFYMIKDSLDVIDPVAILVYRFGVAALVMAVIVKIQKKSLFKHFAKGGAIGVSLWLVYLPQHIGMLYTSASNAGFITAFYVAFVPVLCILFKIPFRPNRVVASLLAMAGMWLLTGGIAGMNKGDMIIMVTPVALTVFILLCDKFLKEGLDPIVLCFQEFLVVAVLSLVWMLVFGNSFEIQTTDAFWMLVYLTVCATILCYVISAYVQQISTPMKIALIYALEPVFTAIFAWKFGGESMTLIQTGGGTLIVLALVISEMPADKFLPFLKRKQIEGP